MPPVRVLAALLAFASGALVAALAFELFEESFVQGRRLVSAVGLAAGAGVYVVTDVVLERKAQASGSSISGIVLLAGVVLDGVPENLALGATLAAGPGSVALLAAIFVSNVPEALVGARSMCDTDGRSGSPSARGSAPRPCSQSPSSPARLPRRPALGGAGNRGRLAPSVPPGTDLRAGMLTPIISRAPAGSPGGGQRRRQPRRHPWGCRVAARSCGG